MASPGLGELVGQLQQLHAANTSAATPSKALLTQAKVQLAQAGLLLPSKPSPQGASTADLEAARAILSYGALLSVREGDFDAFQRYIQQVKPFWDPQLGWVALTLRMDWSILAEVRLPMLVQALPLGVTATLDRPIPAETACKQRHCWIPHPARGARCKE